MNRLSGRPSGSALTTIIPYLLPSPPQRRSPKSPLWGICQARKSKKTQQGGAFVRDLLCQKFWALVYLSPAELDLHGENKAFLERRGGQNSVCALGICHGTVLVIVLGSSCLFHPPMSSDPEQGGRLRSRNLTARHQICASRQLLHDNSNTLQETNFRKFSPVVKISGAFRHPLCGSLICLPCSQAYERGSPSAVYTDSVHRLVTVLEPSHHLFSSMCSNK